jgi:predicted NBD/HSP70 family sugar kinase
MVDNKYLWGIDLGGTKTEGIVFLHGAENKVIKRLRIPTEREKGYEHILQRINHLLDLLKESTGEHPDMVGIGTPGTVDPHTGLSKNSNTTCLNGMPFKSDLEALIGVPVAIANDANCFALAEATLGAVPGALPDAKTAFGVILGTGVGGGVVVDGRVLNGSQGIAGEWGHNYLDESGGPCYCGRSGCVETVISGKGLEQFYEGRAGMFRPLKEIVKLADGAKDKVAVETIDRLHHFFGKAMAPIVNIFDPDAIVLGGGVGNIDSLYDRGVQEVKKYVFNDRMDTLFLKPVLGDSAGVYGAAMLCAGREQFLDR